MQVIMGASLGVVLALCVGLLLFLARKNPKRIKKLFYSFVRTEIQLGINLFLEVQGMHAIGAAPIIFFRKDPFFCRRGIFLPRALATSHRTLAFFSLCLICRVV